MHVDKELQEMLSRLARGDPDACANQPQSGDQPSTLSSTESKGSDKLCGPPRQEGQGSDQRASMSDKKEREPSDTAAKPEGKSLKTSGTPMLSLVTKLKSKL